MKITYKITTLIFTVISLSLILLTLLMHFKYHKTRSELINQRFNVVLNDLKWSIDKSLKFGISLEEIKNIQQLIEQSKRLDANISNITVFKYQNNKVQNLFQTTKTDPNQNLETRIIESMQSTKVDYWSTSSKKGIYYTGISFKDAAGGILGGAYIQYDRASLSSDENVEINHLYIRLIWAICLILILNIVITSSLMKVFNANIAVANQASLNTLEDKSEPIDFNRMSLSELRRKISDLQYETKDTVKSLNRLEKIIEEAK